MQSRKPVIIVGVHGMDNKPPLDRMTRDWKAAITEGLVRNSGWDQPEFILEMVYWADLRYPEPLMCKEIGEPYQPDGGTGPFSGPDTGSRQSMNTLMAFAYKGLTWVQAKTGLTPIDNLLLKLHFDDLWRYQSGTDFAKQARRRLSDQLKALSGHRILLVAHSMGSLIAYDTLKVLEQSIPSVWVDHFITFGSPLGLAEVRLKIEAEHGVARTPNNVGRWSNLSDKRDVATLADKLSKTYPPNCAGVGIDDVAVLNDYHRPSGEPDHHMSYGYLRSPEFSAIIRRNLYAERL